MTAAKHACPHCGSHDQRILADHLGHIGWCRECHRTWEPSSQRPAAVSSVVGEALSPHESRRG